MVPSTVLQLDASHKGCAVARAFLSCTIDLQGQAGDEWPNCVWKTVDKIHERETFRSLAWLTERIRQVGERFTAWQSVEVNDFNLCTRCAPVSPQLIWLQRNRKPVAFEDPIQAGAYERALKSRPAPFTVQLRKDESGIGQLRIGFNAATLLHRALARLKGSLTGVDLKYSWRLETNYNPAAKIPRAKFILTSNKEDVPHTQPPKFKVDLRLEQLRSLTWMLKQESDESPPFIEQEISEAVLEPLQWRAEGRFQQTLCIRGGVLADAVGYGKTAITLALIDCTSKMTAKEAIKGDDVAGKVKTKATLVVVPAQLMKQWDSEVTKFTGKAYRTLVISNVSALNKITIEDIQSVDIVITPSNLFKSEAYHSNLEAFSAGPGLPTTAGRYFRSRVDEVRKALLNQVDLLRAPDGSAAVKAEIRKARKRSTPFVCLKFPRQLIGHR